MEFVHYDTVHTVPASARRPGPCKARMTDKAWEPWKRVMVEMSQKHSYEGIAQYLSDKGVEVAPKTIGHHLRRWGHRKNTKRDRASHGVGRDELVPLAHRRTVDGHTESPIGISDHGNAHIRAQTHSRYDEAQSHGNYDGDMDLLDHFEEASRYPDSILLGTDDSPSFRAQGHGSGCGLTDMPDYNAGVPGHLEFNAPRIDDTPSVSIQPCQSRGKSIQDGDGLHEPTILEIDGDGDAPGTTTHGGGISSSNSSPLSQMSDPGPTTPMDVDPQSPPIVFDDRLNLDGGWELQYDLLISFQLNEPIFRLPATPLEERQEHEFLSSVCKWFQAFWQDDPAGRSLNKPSEVELTMGNFVHSLMLAVLNGRRAFWRVLSELPRRLESALDAIVPNVFTTSAIHLLTLLKSKRECVETVDICLSYLARVCTQALGSTHPLVLLFHMAAARQLTLQSCSRLWTITTGQPVACAGEQRRRWRIRQGHGFGMILYQFGQRDQATELLQLALADSKQTNHICERVSISVDLEMMKRGEDAFGRCAKDINFVWDTIGMVHRMAQLRISDNARDW